MITDAKLVYLQEYRRAIRTNPSKSGVNEAKTRANWKTEFCLNKKPRCQRIGANKVWEGNLTLFQFHRKRDAIAHHARGAHVVPVA